MSGHSKWSSIKHQKAIQDAKRGQTFTKVARLITVASRKGGTDPGSNPSLRQALEEAKQVDMPKDNIERAIERGVGGGESSQLQEMTVEGYGPHGVALLIEVVTDNRNRTLSEIRRVLSRGGGSLAEAGSAAYIFKDKKNPLFEVELKDKQEDEVVKLMAALDELDDVQEIYSNLK